MTYLSTTTITGWGVFQRQVRSQPYYLESAHRVLPLAVFQSLPEAESWAADHNDHTHLEILPCMLDRIQLPRYRLDDRLTTHTVCDDQGEEIPGTVMKIRPVRRWGGECYFEYEVRFADRQWLTLNEAILHPYVLVLKEDGYE